MVSSTLFASVLTMLVAVNGAVVQRDGSASAPATSTSSVPSGTVDCDNAQQWQYSFAYVKGDEVIYNDKLYKAKQWTYANAPPAHADQWTLEGKCAKPIDNKVDCSGVAAWSSTVAYTAWSTVTFDNHLWQAVQWVESNKPDDASGSWQDLGACY